MSGTPSRPSRSSRSSCPSCPPALLPTPFEWPHRSGWKWICRSAAARFMVLRMRNFSGAEAVVYGGLVVGALDAIDAVVFFGLRGATPVRVFQGIAAGLLGRATLEGGLRTALLGLAIH